MKQIGDTVLENVYWLLLASNNRIKKQKWPSLSMTYVSNANTSWNLYVPNDGKRWLAPSRRLVGSYYQKPSSLYDLFHTKLLFMFNSLCEDYIKPYILLLENWEDRTEHKNNTILVICRFYQISYQLLVQHNSKNGNSITGLNFLDGFLFFKYHKRKNKVQNVK